MMMSGNTERVKVLSDFELRLAKIREWKLERRKNRFDDDIKFSVRFFTLNFLIGVALSLIGTIAWIVFGLAALYGLLGVRFYIGYRRDVQMIKEYVPMEM